MNDTTFQGDGKVVNVPVVVNTETMTVEEWKRKNPPIKRKPLTNADRIRAMTDEELADLFNNKEVYDSFECPVPKACSYYDNCRECFLEWLRKEAE